MEGESEEVPSYVLPLFFTSKTQELFECIGDEQVTEEAPYKLITKEKIFQDFRERAAVSDFHPAKKIIEVGCIWIFGYRENRAEVWQ